MAILTYTDTKSKSLENNVTYFSVVFIHGFCESKNIWKKFIQPLSSTYRIISIDLPSDIPNGSLTLETMATAIHETLETLAVKEVILIGHSLGGYVALAYAEAYQTKVKGLGLFHSSAFADSEEKKQNRNKVIDSIKENGTEALVRTILPDLFYKENKPKFQAVIDELIAEAKQLPPEVVIKTVEAMRDRKDRSDLLEKLEVPVLFIVGKEDQAVPLSISLQQIALPKNSVVHILGEVGHMGMFEAEEKTQKAVENFISYCQ